MELCHGVCRPIIHVIEFKRGAEISQPDVADRRRGAIHLSAGAEEPPATGRPTRLPELTDRGGGGFSGRSGGPLGRLWTLSFRLTLRSSCRTLK